MTRRASSEPDRVADRIVQLLRMMNALKEYHHGIWLQERDAVGSLVASATAFGNFDNVGRLRASLGPKLREVVGWYGGNRPATRYRGEPQEHMNARIPREIRTWLGEAHEAIAIWQQTHGADVNAATTDQLLIDVLRFVHSFWHRTFNKNLLSFPPGAAVPEFSVDDVAVLSGMLELAHSFDQREELRAGDRLAIDSVLDRAGGLNITSARTLVFLVDELPPSVQGLLTVAVADARFESELTALRLAYAVSALRATGSESAQDFTFHDIQVIGRFADDLSTARFEFEKTSAARRSEPEDELPRADADLFPDAALVLRPAPRGPRPTSQGETGPAWREMVEAVERLFDESQDDDFLVDLRDLRQDLDLVAMFAGWIDSDAIGPDAIRRLAQVIDGRPDPDLVRGAQELGYALWNLLRDGDTDLRSALEQLSSSVYEATPGIQAHEQTAHLGAAATVFSIPFSG